MQLLCRIVTFAGHTGLAGAIAPALLHKKRCSCLAAYARLGGWADPPAGKKVPAAVTAGTEVGIGERSRAPQRTVRLQLPQTQPRRALIWINLNVRSSATQTTSLRPLPAADLHRVIHRHAPRCGDMRSPTTGARGARIVRRPGGRRYWRCGSQCALRPTGGTQRLSGDWANSSGCRAGLWGVMGCPAAHWGVMVSQVVGVSADQRQERQLSR